MAKNTTTTENKNNKSNKSAKKLTVENLPKGVIDPNEDKLKLDAFVRRLAKHPRLNLGNYSTLKRICKEMVQFSETNKIPMSFLAYIGVSTSAHKLNGFLANYAKWNPARAEAITLMAKHFAAHFGYATPTDRVYHAMYKVHNDICSNVEDVKAAIDTLDVANDFNKGMDVPTIANKVSEALSEVLSVSVVTV